jgi:hypothetical protein
VICIKDIHSSTQKEEAGADAVKRSLSHLNTKFLLIVFVPFALVVRSSVMSYSDKSQATNLHWLDLPVLASYPWQAEKLPLLRSTLHFNRRHRA